MKDPYTYEGTNVLINKADIRNQEKLDEFETTMVQLALIDLMKREYVINTVFDIYTIHRLLFQEVYDWAGKKRTINIYKNEPVLDGMSVSYTDYDYIDEDLKRVDKDLLSIKWESLNLEEKIKNIRRIIADIWRTHAFREGNTRTVSVFLYLLTKRIGVKLNTSIIEQNAKFFRNALVMASIDEYSEYQHLEGLLMDAITIKTKSYDVEKYKTINDYNLDEYEYNYHEIKRQ